jgi:multidrug efflux pump subunit AcrB
MRRLGIIIIGVGLAAGIATATWLLVRHGSNAERATRVSIRISAAGMTPEEAEMLVAVPLETGLAQMSGLTDLRSTCTESLVQIEASFEPKIPRVQVVFAVRQRLEGVQLPQEVEQPLVAAPITRPPIWSYALRCTRCAPGALQSIQEQELRPALLALRGVANVSASGGGRPELLIQADPVQLQRTGLTPGALAAAISSHLVDSRHTLRLISIKGVNPADLPRIVVSRGTGGEVRLRDVAQIRMNARPPACKTLHNGSRALYARVHGFTATTAAAADLSKLRARIDQIVKRHAARGLMMSQLDPRRALELRLLTGDHAATRSPKNVPGLRDLVVRICDDRADGDSRLWAWGSPGSPPPKSALLRAALAPRSVPQDGSSRALVVELLGPDREVLARRGRAVVRWLSKRGELETVETEPSEGRNQITIRLLRDRAAKLGLTMSNLATSLRIARYGIEVAQLQTKAGLLPVKLILGRARPTASGLARLQIRTASGAMVPLAQVAEVRLSRAPAALHRCNQQRCRVIRAWGPAEGFEGWSSRLRADLEARFSGAKLRVTSPGER